MNIFSLSELSPLLVSPRRGKPAVKLARGGVPVRPADHLLKVAPTMLGKPTTGLLLPPSIVVVSVLSSTTVTHLFERCLWFNA